MDTEYVKGLDALDKVLAEFGHKAVVAGGDLLYQRMEAMMTDSKANYVPVDQSTLQGTGHVEAPIVEDENVSVRAAYGGPAADYAEAVHEHLSEHSPASWKAAEASGRGVHFTQGGPKYLEKPFLIASRDVAQFVANGIKEKLGT